MSDEEDVSAARQVKLTACIPTMIINYNISSVDSSASTHLNINSYFYAVKGQVIVTL
jgi:hypothetical protein